MQEEKFETYEVYKLTNLVNNKVYIGCTTQGSGSRFQKHICKANSGSDYPLHKAIREFGDKKFKLDILEFCNNEDEMQTREIFYIANFDSTNPEKGYNVRPGGGIHRHTEETKQKIGDIHRGKVSDRRKPILQYSKDGEFIREYESLTAAGEATGITRNSILKSIRKELMKPTRLNPYIWIYKDPDKLIATEVDPKEHYKDLNYVRKMSDACIAARGRFQTTDGDLVALSKPVARIENGVEVARFDSMTQAAKAYNTSVRTIKTHIEKNIGDWRFVETSIEDSRKLAKENALRAARMQGKKVSKYSPVTNEIVIFETLSDAAKAAGNVDRKTLKYHIDKEDLWRGYIWRYVD